MSPVSGIGVLVGLLVVAQAVPPGQAPGVTAPAYVPERVYDAGRRAFVDFESMLADLATADVVLVGEQHGDPNTHRLEAAFLDGLRRRGIAVTLSLEMFERDTQAGLDAYLAGSVSEAEFLQSSRPWPRYATDYRPLVEIARTQGWPVIASNMPRRHAASVAKTGLSALDSLAATERAWVAAELQCPRDSYFTRFANSMKGHQAPGAKPSATEKPPEASNAAAASDKPPGPPDAPVPARAPGPPSDDPAMTERYYYSQCVKDETMAEAIAGGYERHGRKLVVHVNGAFHSDFGLGTAARVRRRLTGRRAAVVSLLPVKDLDTLAPTSDDLARADYLVYTIADARK
jgi:uncharacterized iron-regulated protein